MPQNLRQLLLLSPASLKWAFTHAYFHNRLFSQLSLWLNLNKPLQTAVFVWLCIHTDVKVREAASRHSLAAGGSRSFTFLL